MFAPSGQPDPRTLPLPTLRQELSIQKGGASWTGAPTWLLYDGFRNKYFRIDVASFEILSRWRPMPAGQLQQILSVELNRMVGVKEIVDLAEFLFANSLTQAPPEDDWKSYHRQAEGQKKSWWKTVLHNYLFFRVPIARPQKFLDSAWPLVSLLFTKTSVLIFVLMAILGLYLVQRQWQVFVTTFLDFLTFNGIMVYGASLVGVKIIHELGHAFMARKYKVDVPIMGAAFILLFPILYTDTTGATRLSNKKDRLMIDLAGIYAELALASVATLLWVFLPDGPLRSVAFTTATLSWVLSLAVNLNPFMRFDGYYVFSDMTGIENLQDRGFAMGKWRLRELLFNTKQRAPEVLPKSWRRLVILHAWGTWIYRLMLFLGIALVVYAFFVKVIGIFLFIIEILWFVLLPIWRELLVWFELRKEIKSTKRSKMTVACLVSLGLFLIVPWSSKVEVPATMRHLETATVYAPVSGKIITHEFVDGDVVKKGDILLKMESPDIDSEIKLSMRRLKLLQTRLDRSNADQAERSLLTVLKREFESEKQSLQGLIKKKEQLIVRAPISGTLTNVDGEVHNGLWLNSNYKLALIRPQNGVVLKGMVSQVDLSRIQAGDSGRFIFDNSEFGSTPIKVAKINDVAANSLPELYMADVYGGRIPTTQAQQSDGPNAGPKPRGSWFGVDLELSADPSQDMTQERAGTAIVYGERVSMANRIFTRIASVLIRETGI